MFCGISVPKIISERCELVKLCNISCSGPVCVETHCSLCMKELNNKFITDVNAQCITQQPALYWTKRVAYFGFT